MKNKLTKYDLAFLTPGLLVFTIFLLIPLTLSFVYSFTNWNGFGNVMNNVGFRNYKMLLSDSAFWNSFKTTIALTFITTFVGNSLGITIAAIIEPKSKVNNIAKTMIFIPAILSGVVVSFIWSYMTQTNGGIINTMLGWVHIPPIDLYASNQSMTVMVSLVIAWAALGFYTTVYIANISNISEEIYEAAEIDGASPIRTFFSITVPLLQPAIIINVTTAVIWGLKQYDFVKVMIPGTVQTVAVYAVERAFEYNMFGYSSAIIVILLIFTLFISALQIRVTRHKEIDY